MLLTLTLLWLSKDSPGEIHLWELAIQEWIPKLDAELTPCSLSLGFPCSNTTAKSAFLKDLAKDQMSLKPQ